MGKIKMDCLAQTILKKRKIWVFMAILPLTVILLFNLYRMSIGCIKPIDFAIYQEALYKLAAFESWNPYIFVRDSHIFNDHVDPILFFQIPFIWLTGFSPYGLLFIEWLWVIATLPLCFFLIKKSGSTNAFYKSLFFVFLISFSKAVLTALQYPVHPTTWLILPTILLFYFLKREQWRLAALMVLFTTLFRESIVFSHIGLGLGLIFTSNKSLKKRNLGFFIFILGVGLYFLIFKLRPLLIGETYRHGEDLLKNLLLHPWSTLYNAAKVFEYKALFKVYAPFLIPLWFALKFIPRKSRLTDLIPLLSFLAPMLLVHFLSNKIGYHYGTQMVGPVIGYLIGSRFFDTLFENKKIFIFQILLMVGNGISHYSKHTRYYFFQKDSRCYTGRDKLPYLREFEKSFHSVDPNASFLSTGGVFPRLMNTKSRFFYLKGFSAVQPSYDYIILERYAAGDVYPAYPKSIQYIETLLTKCERQAKKVLVKNKFYFFAKGPFTHNCR